MTERAESIRPAVPEYGSWFRNMGNTGLTSWSGREKALAVVAVVAAVAAIVGFVLFGTSQVPSDAAAKVGDTYIKESEVETSINQYRSSYGLTDDTAFASALVQQGLTAGTFRQQIIEEKATAILVDARAKELGLTPTSDEVDEQFNTLKSSMSFNSDDIWQETLSRYGMTEDGLRDQIRVNLEKTALYEAEVAHQDASDSDALSYAQSKLAGVTQQHFYRMVFTGSDAMARANAAATELAAMKEAGTLNTETFSQMARERSNEEGVAQTGGSFKWAVEISSDDDLSSATASLAVGDVSDPESIDSDDGALEIFYCDTQYSFPSSSAISSLKASDVPESLWTVVKSQAGEALWQSSCSVYLSNMLMAGKVTYYPMPDSASYNIPITVASSSASTSSSSSTTKSVG